MLTTELDAAAYARVADRAGKHGRTIEQQAAFELSADPPPVPAPKFRVLPPPPGALSAEAAAAAAKQFRDELTASGRVFPDSVADIREDRDR